MTTKSHLEKLVPCGNFRRFHVAILTESKTGKVICSAVNNVFRAHYSHAENMAVRKLGRMIKTGLIKDRVTVDMVVYRISSSGVLGESRPCTRCMKHIIKSSEYIKTISWSVKGGGMTKMDIDQFSNIKTARSSGDVWSRKA